MAHYDKHENVFDLVKSMSKAEKRNFKLYATRLAGNEQAKFIVLFDHLDSVDEYDEGKVLEKCPITKQQLPNMKAHLYKQILVSIRLLSVNHSIPMQLREQLDFARILYDKGLYRQSTKILEKVHAQAEQMHQHTILLDIIHFEKQIETINVAKDMGSKAEALAAQVDAVNGNIDVMNHLSTTALQLYSLHQKLGYARSQKDKDLITSYFWSKLDLFANKKMSFMEQLYYYEAMAWYYYIKHNFVMSYKYACRWVALFDREPRMKEILYDSFLKGFSRLLEGLYMMRKYHKFVDRLDQFGDVCELVAELNDNAVMLSRQTLLENRMNRHFLEGSFDEGVLVVRDVDAYVGKFSRQISQNNKMLLYYKAACLFFGNGNYSKCMEYLSKVTSTRDPQIRRDLQCYAKILLLICSYELGLDHNMEYQIRSVYSFLVKMNDMHEVQKEMLSFLKRLNTIYESDLGGELRKLYERLKTLESHPYERRSFYYLDVISWLESKITGASVGEIIRQNFRKEFGAHKIIV